MPHDRGLPHTVSAPGQGRIVQRGQGNLNQLPNIIPLGVAGKETNNFTNGNLNNQQVNDFTNGKVQQNQPDFMDGNLRQNQPNGNLKTQPNFMDGRLDNRQNKFTNGQLDKRQQRQNQFTEGRLGRKQPNFTEGKIEKKTTLFTEGRLSTNVNKLGPQGFRKQISVPSAVPTINLPVPNSGNIRRQTSYDQMYGTTESKQNALKDKYARANLRKKKGSAVNKISTGTSILDAYKNLGRR